MELSLAVDDLLEIIRADEQTEQSVRPFIELPDKTANRIGVKRIVRRVCYDHILPRIVANMDHDLRNNNAITGTPGIGKTLFGYFLLRNLIEDPTKTVVYWNDKYAILFSTTDDVIKFYSLPKSQAYDINGVTWRVGCWHAAERNLGDLLTDERVYVIHDPAEDFVYASTNNSNTRTSVILSSGHKTIGKWATKRTGAPDILLYMPFFTRKEIIDNKSNLFHGLELDDNMVQQKYQLFGGSIRHYTGRTSDSAWNELKQKVQQVARTGNGLVARTDVHKGSIVHVWVDFDEQKAVFPKNGYNEFSETEKEYVLGSEKIASELSTALEVAGKDALTTFMNGIYGQSGAEAVYGMLFEKFAHNMLMNDNKNREFNIRVVRKDGKEKLLWATVKIPVSQDKVLRFTGREANGVREYLEREKKISTGMYILPEASNFPTYDSAVIIPASNVGLVGKNIGLLLQMTVSGASGLRRRPKHSVRHYMRKAMDKVLRENAEDPFDTSITTFCVPSACFHPFQYQSELQQDKDDCVADSSQADYQFVLEIPGFTPLRRSDDSPVGIHGKTGRVHAYELRPRRLKKAKIDAEFFAAET